MLRFGNRFVSRFLANAQSVADKMSADESVQRNRFDVIYNGVDLELFDKLSEEPPLPSFTEFIQGKRVVCSAANLRPVKNVGSLVRACGELAQSFDDLAFVFMGEGAERPALEAETRRLGIEDRTIWMGEISNIVPYLVRSHVACLSSDSEGFSNSILEYMAAQLPVVATRVGGNAEAIIEGETGFTCEPRDHLALASKLKSILDLDDEKRKQMGLAGRRRVEDSFSMRKQLSNYDSLYQRELNSAERM